MEGVPAEQRKEVLPLDSVVGPGAPRPQGMVSAGGKVEYRWS